MLGTIDEVGARSGCVLVAASLVLACSQRAFECSQHEQCGGQGTCEPTGFCSFPDMSCPSGRRYGEHAGQLAGACVDPSVDTSTETDTASVLDDGSGSMSAGPGGGPTTDGGGPMSTTPLDDGPSTSDDEPTAGSLGSTGPIDSCDWSHQRSVTIAAGLSDEPLDDFPVLVRLVDDALGVAQSDARDIRFLMGAQILSHEIEVFDDATGTLVAWVRVPSIAAGSDTALTMQWGNPAASDGADPAGVWDEAFVGVWHLSDPPAGAGSIRDSTSNEHHGTPAGGLAAGALASGQVGRGLELDGVDDSIVIPNDFGGQLTQFTLSAWANVAGGHDTTIFWRLNGDYLYPRGDILQNGSYRMQLRVDNVVDLIYSPSMIANGLHHFVFVYSLTQGVASELWLDGQLIASKSLAGSSLSGGQYDLELGIDTDIDGHLEGLLDEVRLSNIVRSHAWIAASYRLQADPDPYVTFGPVGAPSNCD